MTCRNQWYVAQKYYSNNKIQCVSQIKSFWKRNGHCATLNWSEMPLTFTWSTHLYPCIRKAALYFTSNHNILSYMNGCTPQGKRCTKKEVALTGHSSSQFKHDYCKLTNIPLAGGHFLDQSLGWLKACYLVLKILSLSYALSWLNVFIHLISNSCKNTEICEENGPELKVNFNFQI